MHFENLDQTGDSELARRRVNGKLVLINLAIDLPGIKKRRNYIQLLLIYYVNVALSQKIHYDIAIWIVLTHIDSISEFLNIIFY